MTALCLEYSVSRQTGYKWIDRFKAQGLEGLAERSRRPHGSPIATSGEVVLQVLQLRANYGWGPKKLQKLLVKRLKPGEKVPSRRTIARILLRVGVVKRRRQKPVGSVLAAGAPRPNVNAPNDLWTVDFKGWWRAKDGARCEPLTVRDGHSRFVLCAVVMASPNLEPVRKEFERLFEKYGVPKAILSDNGNPFACTRALAGLTQLSAWWVNLGIEVLHSRPAHPQDNGAHERMHVDMLPLEERSANHREAQQLACDRWRHEFNHIRPHEALEMKTPAEVYKPTRRMRRQLPKVMTATYPEGAMLRRVVRTGSFSWQGRTVFVSRALRGYSIAVICGPEGQAKVMFHHLVMGQFEIERGRTVEALPIPLPIPECQPTPVPPSADVAK
jgi:transposase InsO family protein